MKRAKIAVIALAAWGMLLGMGAASAQQSPKPSWTTSLGTNTVTRYDVGERWESYLCSFVTDATGRVSTDLFHINGVLERITIVPTSTSNLWDVTLSDISGVDVLAANGMNQSNTVASSFVPRVAHLPADASGTNYSPVVLSQSLALRITNGGNAKAGKIFFIVRKN